MGETVAVCVMFVVIALVICGTVLAWKWIDDGRYRR